MHHHHHGTTITTHTKKRQTHLLSLSQSCNVTGNMDVCCTGGDVVEVLQMLSEWHGVPIPHALQTMVPNTPSLKTAGHIPADLPLIDDKRHVLFPMQQALLQGGQCDCCLRGGVADAWERVVVITPCLHVLCVEHAQACGKPGDAEYAETCHAHQGNFVV